MGLRAFFVATCVAMQLTSCASTSSDDRILFYRVKVQRGESLAQIAARFDTTWQSIVNDNDLDSASDITAGMMIKVRPGPGGFLAGTEGMSRERSARPKKRGLFSSADDSEESNGNSTKRRGLLFDGGSSSNMIWPARGKITSPYGMRNGRMHDGIDIDGETGDKVVAAAKGVVRLAETTSGYGKTVIISHGSYTTLYAHLDSIDVDEGDVLDRGDAIGEMGESGHATGPHLHFEVRNAKNKPQNPIAYLQKRRDGSLFSSR